MNITVDFVGVLRKLDPGGEWVDITTVSDIVSRVPGLKTDPVNFLVSRNGDACDLNTKLEDGDRIRFVPMLMGG